MNYSLICYCVLLARYEIVLTKRKQKDFVCLRIKLAQFFTSHAYKMNYRMSIIMKLQDFSNLEQDYFLRFLDNLIGDTTTLSLTSML